VALTRKQREAEREKDGKLYLFLLAVGFALLFLSSFRWLGVHFLLARSGLLYLDYTKGRKRRQALLRLGVEDLDALNWEQFEELLLVMFRKSTFFST